MLSVSQKLNLLDLYDEEIKSRIAIKCKELGKLESLISKARVNEIFEHHPDDRAEIAAELWAEFRQSALKINLYEEVLMFLKDVDVDLHTMIYVENYYNEFIIGFCKMLKHYSGLMKVMEPIGDVLESLKEVPGFGELFEPVRLRFEAGTLNDQRAKKIILRYTPLLTVYGYEHLLYAILGRGGEAEKFVNQICQNFSNEYEYLKQTANNPHGLFHIIYAEDDIAQKIKESLAQGTGSKNAYCARIGKIPPIHQRACIIDFCKEVPLNLRRYQQELVREACLGHNVVICAPTGSGKTVVGAYIVRNHLYKSIQNHTKAKVCFFVPTAALVEQQYQLLQKYLGHFAKVRGICGNFPSAMPNRQTIEDADVIVITPQIIVNLLTEQPTKYIDDFVPFRLSLFTMLLFDEAHHADEKHPYNIVLEKYHEMRDLGSRSEKLPQVIGMTASLGIGSASAKGLADAVTHTLSMCANLNAHFISRVRDLKNIDELKRCTADTRDYTKLIDNTECERLEFYRILQRQLFFFEQQLLTVEEAKTIPEIKNLLADKPANRVEQTYEQWIYMLEKEVPVNERLCSESRRFLVHCTEQLKIFYNAADLLRLFGSKSALDYITSAEEPFFATKIDDDVPLLKDTICRLKILPDYESELLSELIRILNAQFAKLQNSRALIFVHRRNYCRRLAALLDEKTDLSVDYLTGQTSTNENGMNLADQKKKITEFADGRKNVLCVTTVAEEGIDISECNLVIEYNNVATDIARIQRRGRGRAKNAISILLTLDVSIQKRSEQNAIREQLMTDALNEVDKKSNTWFRAEVDRHINILREDRLRAKALAEEKRSTLRNSQFKYALICMQVTPTFRKCDGFLAFSDKVSVISNSQYVIVDVDVWKRVGVGALPASCDDKLLLMSSPLIGEHYCSNQTDSGVCGKKMGAIIIHHDVRLPIISCKYVVFVEVPKECKEFVAEPSGGLLRRRVFTKWKQVLQSLFMPEQITDLDLKQMQLAEREMSETMVDVVKNFQIRRDAALQQVQHRRAPFGDGLIF